MPSHSVISDLTCPTCGTIWPAGTLLCTCGYNLSLLPHAEFGTPPRPFVLPAVLSCVFGIIAIAGILTPASWLSLNVFACAAVISGHVALKLGPTGRGLARVGLVLGYLLLSVFASLYIVAYATGRIGPRN
jgi:hypothetical protein